MSLLLLDLVVYIIIRVFFVTSSWRIDRKNTESADEFEGMMISAPMSCTRSRPCRRRRLVVAPNQMIPDFKGLSWSRTEAFNLFILSTSFLIFAIVSATRMRWMADLRTSSRQSTGLGRWTFFDHCRAVLSINNKFSGPMTESYGTQ